MRTINKIILHCSATKPNQDIGKEEINRWHKDQGFNEIGYHYVIKRDGTLEKGRNIEKVGAHCQGHNTNSIGICLVGGINAKGKADDNFTLSQFESLGNLLKTLTKEYPEAKIYPHSAFARKDCPCFDVKVFLKFIEIEQFLGA